ncbi:MULTISPECIES: hypothetical protein [unclassified Pseudobutyrivibrio]|nr:MULTISPECIES: hypothetical protein [unclassified Pseudobutyrivibrio]
MKNYMLRAEGYIGIKPVQAYKNAKKIENYMRGAKIKIFGI